MLQLSEMKALKRLQETRQCLLQGLEHQATKLSFQKGRLWMSIILILALKPPVELKIALRAQVMKKERNPYSLV